jgi:very-short-patch-repair endonuclease
VTVDKPDRERVRELRREQTPAEWLLWRRLRERQVLGQKFRRQCPISRYIADFCCKELRLVVEVDGEVHEDEAQIAHDQNRDAYLRSLDYEVLRFSNQQVLGNVDEVLAEITRTILRLCPSIIHTPDYKLR